MPPAHPFDREAEALHLARSRFLDAYGSVEAAICERLSVNGFDPGNRSVGQKIDALRAVKASPRYSKSERKRIHEVLDKVEAQNEIRCDIVHAPLKVISLDGESMACFINPRRLGQTTIVARHISLRQFDQLIEEISAIAGQLIMSPG